MVPYDPERFADIDFEQYFRDLAILIKDYSTYQYGSIQLAETAIDMGRRLIMIREGFVPIGMESDDLNKPIFSDEDEAYLRLKY